MCVQRVYSECTPVRKLYSLQCGPTVLSPVWAAQGRGCDPVQNIGVDRDSSERTINVEPVLLLEDARRASTMLKWTVVTKPETFRKRIVVSICSPVHRN